MQSFGYFYVFYDVLTDSSPLSPLREELWLRDLHKLWYLVLYVERKPLHDLTKTWLISYKELEAIF